MTATVVKADASDAAAIKTALETLSVDGDKIVSWVIGSSVYFAQNIN